MLWLCVGGSNGPFWVGSGMATIDSRVSHMTKLNLRISSTSLRVHKSLPPPQPRSTSITIRSPTIMAAKVLDTYELLKDVLLHLPLRQLLLAQRVNKRFHGVIQDSRNIKRALFLEPSSTSPVEWWPSTQPDSGMWHNDDCIWTRLGEKSEQVVLPNPFIKMYTNLLSKSAVRRSANVRQS